MRKHRNAFIVLLVLLCTSAFVKAQERRLESIHGTMITMISEKQGIVSEIWAKGNYLRSEMDLGGEKLISLQRDGVVYVYPSRGNIGMKRLVGRGLGSLGLVKQIHEIKSRGEIHGSEEIEGVLCDLYAYDVNLPEESALVLLSRETSLPTIWVSILRTDDQEPVAQRTVFKNLEANVKISDDLFEIPKSVRFSEEDGSTFPSIPKSIKSGDSHKASLKKATRKSQSNLYAVSAAKAKVMSDDGVVITTLPIGTVIGSSQSKGELRLIEKGSKSGWIDDRDLIPFEIAREHFSNELRNRPQDPNLLLGRARFSYWVAQSKRMSPGSDKAEFDQILDYALADFKQSAFLRPSIDAYAGSGFIHALQGNHKEAIADFNRGLKFDPNATELLQQRAWAWLSSGDFDNAIADCDRILEHDEMNPAAHGLKCYALGRKGEWDNAMTECDIALQVEPRLASAFFYRGTIWEGKGDDSRAKIDFDSAIAFGENAARSHRARIWYQSGKMREAIADLSVSVELEPNNADLWLQRGSAHLQLENLDQGIEDLSKSIELKATPEALTNRAIAWIKKNEVKLAIEDFKRSAILNPDLALTHFNIARLYYDLGQYKESVAALSEYLRLMPEDPDGYAQRGMARYFSQDFENAIADFSFSIKRNPENATLRVYRGSAFNSTKDFDRAIDDFTHAIEVDPGSAMAYTLRGASWNEKGDSNKAAIDFEKAVVLDPKSHVAYINRGGFYYSHGNYEKAKLDFETVLKLNPGQAPVMNELAELLATAPVENVRNGVQAVRLARTACELTNWKEAEYLGTLASAYAESGDFPNAVLWQSKCVEMSTEELKKDARAKLALYQEKKPYRKEPRSDHFAK